MIFNFQNYNDNYLPLILKSQASSAANEKKLALLRKITSELKGYS